MLVRLECQLAGRMGLGVDEVRRAPLALALLWLHSVCQEEGLETRWKTGGDRSREEVRARMAELRAMAEER